MTGNASEKKKALDAFYFEIKQQAVILLSVLLLTCCVGLPIWVMTTTPYRAPLDAQEMMNLDNYHFDLSLDLNVVFLFDSEQKQNKNTETLKATLLQRLQKEWELQVDTEKKKLSTAINLSFSDAIFKEKSFDNLETLDKTLLAYAAKGQIGSYTCFILPKQQQEIKNVIIGKYSHAFVPNTDEVDTDLFDAFSALLPDFKKCENCEQDENMVVTSASSYHVSFTLLAGDPYTSSISWDYSKLINELVKPAFKKIDPHAELSFDSQVLYHTSLRNEVTPTKENEQYFCIDETKMPLFVDPHWNIVQVTERKTVNFLVYIPDRRQTPLHFCSFGTPSLTNAYVVPKWGGVVICNSDVPQTNNEEIQLSLKSDTMDNIKMIFSNQLRTLLGVKSHSPTNNIQYLKAGDDIVSEWEGKSVRRRLIIENSQRAVNAFYSLASLLERIPNIVIADHLSENVKNGLDFLKQTKHEIQIGNDLSALQKSHSAFDFSELAFFDPSMMELLYFPDDNKFAIYVPFLVPSAMTIAGSIFRLMKKYKSLR